MESDKFDALVRGAFARRTRRGVMRVGIGAVAATALATFELQADADAKKKKKKKKRRCRGNRPVKCGKGCCPTNFSQCCEDASEPTNFFTCNPVDFTCCSVDDGGGSCPPFLPQCCPPTILDPFGTCALESEICCPSEVGGACSEEFPVCCLIDPEDPFSGNCCAEGETCCLDDDDCQGTDVCADFFCCVPEVTVKSGLAGQRRNRRTRKGGTERFYKKAK